MLLRGHMLLSHPWPELEHDDYYWEHTYWVDSDDFPNNAQMSLATLQDMKLLYSTLVKTHSQRWYVGSSTTLFFQQNYSAGNTGAQTAQANPTLLIAARWRMKGADGSHTYHLHRQPIGEAYLEDAEYSTTGRTQQQTRMNTYIAQGIYRTQTGSLITFGQLAPSPIGWQLRHGTKRRNRRGWLP